MPNVYMETWDQLKDIFNNNIENPSRCKEACLQFLDEKCARGSELDPRNPQNDHSVYRFYKEIAELFLKNGFESTAPEILIDAWRKFQKIQKDEGTFIYKAAIAVSVSDIYYAVGDIGAALRWALIAQAEDALCGHFDGEAKLRLQEIHGMTNAALDALQDIALSNAQDLAGDWSNPSAFGEDVLLQFVLKHQEFGGVLGHASSVLEFPLSNGYASGLLERVEPSNGAGSKKKHDSQALEDLVSYLFFLIPGWIPYHNAKSNKNDDDTDIVVTNLAPTGNLNAELFGRNVLVECRNWDDRVGTNQVGYFLYRMRLMHTRFGVIFARNGLTGDRNNRKNKGDAQAAQDLIIRAFHEDGYICIVIEYDELQRIVDSQRSFWSLLLEKARQVQFGVSVEN